MMTLCSLHTRHLFDFADTFSCAAIRLMHLVVQRQREGKSLRKRGIKEMIHPVYYTYMSSLWLRCCAGTCAALAHLGGAARFGPAAGRVREPHRELARL